MAPVNKNKTKARPVYNKTKAPKSQVELNRIKKENHEIAIHKQNLEVQMELHNLEKAHTRFQEELEAGDNAAAVTLQSRARSINERLYEEKKAELAASLTISSAQRSHLYRKNATPLPPISSAMDTMLLNLNKNSNTPNDGMLQLEDRTTFMMQTLNTKVVTQEIEILYDENGEMMIDASFNENSEVEINYDEDGQLIDDSIPLRGILRTDDGNDTGNEARSVAKSVRIVTEAKGEPEPDSSMLSSSILLGILNNTGSDFADSNSNTKSESNPKFKTVTTTTKSLNPFVTMSVNKNNDVTIPITETDKSKWLGTHVPEKIPLDKEIRKKKRQENYNYFDNFVNQTLNLLDDFHDRELLIEATLEIKEKARDIILGTDKKFFECLFGEQLNHEFLHKQPLVSQREFQEMQDNYDRPEKEGKMLRATIARIDKYDCTFLACKMIMYHIDDYWAHKIGAAMKGNNFLQHLYLNQNFISDKGVTGIAHSLRNNTALKILNLSGNLITDEGAFEIGEMLKENTALCELNLDYKEKKRSYRDKDKIQERITAPGGAMVGFSLQTNFSLTALSMTGQNIWDAGAAAIATTLKQNNTLKVLNLSFNDIKTVGGMALSNSLKFNTGLEHCNFAGNHFCDKVGRNLALMLHVNRSIETFDLHSNDFSVRSVNLLEGAVEENDVLRAVSVYNNSGLTEKQRDLPEFDNLVSGKIKRYEENKHVKNMIIWHKRLFGPCKNDEADYAGFLEFQFGIVEDADSGKLMLISDLEKREKLAKETGNGDTHAHAHNTNAEFGELRLNTKISPPASPSPTSGKGKQSHLQQQLAATNAKANAQFLSGSPTNKPTQSLSMNITEQHSDLNERLWEAWQTYTAKSEAESTLGSINVKAYNKGSEPHYDSLTRLMQLRVPIPGAPFEAGTVSICRLVYLKEGEKQARRDLGQEGWFKAQKEASMAWTGHIHAKPNLPPDKYVEHEYYKNFDHVYPRGIDAKRNDKKEKDLENLRLAFGGDQLKNAGYGGVGFDAKKQMAIDKEMQRLNVLGVSDKERITAMRKMGGVKVLTVGDMESYHNDKKKITTHERKGNYSKAHIGQPKFKKDNSRAEVMRKDLDKGRKNYEKHDYNSYTNPKKDLVPYQLFNHVARTLEEETK